MSRVLMAALGGLLALAACGPAGPPPATAPTPAARPDCSRFLPLPAADSPARHLPPTPDLPPAPARAAPAFRAAVHTLAVDDALAQLAAAAGFDTIVQVFPWRDLNPQPGTFTWAAADAMLRAAHAQGLALVARLDMPPAWAARPEAPGLPFDLAAYAAFAGAVAQRYRGHLLGYLIWNEPNLAAEWSYSGDPAPDHWEAYRGRVADPADYLGVVGAAYAAIKAADPQALVAAGGLAPTNEVSERALDDREFLRQLYAAGPPPCFDVLAVHAYGYGLAPEVDAEANAGLNLARLADVRALMTAAGDTRPVWVTELGYTVDAGNHPV
ncbi:MAG: hypothetical protein JNK29_02215, partial [Anaerolineales bacterium]|nr:hypothetical protein [Anaerolineales bacterium]